MFLTWLGSKLWWPSSNKSALRHVTNTESDDAPDFVIGDLENDRPFPMDYLPLEIYTKVINLWVEIDPDAPWVASLTSRLWRKRILSQRQAWSHIHVHFRFPGSMAASDNIWGYHDDPEDFCWSGRGTPRPLALWFQRAGSSAPITFSMEITEFYPRQQILSKVYDELNDHASQIRELSLRIVLGPLASYIIAILREKLTSLGHLSVECKESKSRDLDELWHVSSLRSLSLSGCRFPKGMASRKDLLTEYALSGVDRTKHNSALEFLRGCINLRRLEIYGLSSKADDSSIFLPSLEDLSVEISYRENKAKSANALQFILSNIRAPKLRSLSINCRAGVESLMSEEPEEAAAFLKVMEILGATVYYFVQSTPQLEKLDLVETCVEDRQLYTILKLLPQLTVLRLYKSAISTEGLHYLTNDPSLCPKLLSLRLERCALLPGADIIKFMKTRMASISTTYFTLRVSHCKSVTDAEAEELDSLSNGPIDVLAG